MRKFHDPLNPTPTRKGRSRAPAFVAVVVCLLAAPPAYEAGLIVVDRWASMAGTYREHRTPILDAIADGSRDAYVGAQRSASGVMNGGSWRPSTAVPIGIAWAVLMAAVFLRRAARGDRPGVNPHGPQ